MTSGILYRYVTSTAKRLGEKLFFSGAFVVIRPISVIFRAFCLEVLGNFVYLHIVWELTLWITLYKEMLINCKYYVMR